MDYKDALERTPGKYRDFVTPIKGNAYMRVDGRISMLMDEQPRTDDRLEVRYTEFQIGALWFIRAHVSCARGYAEGSSHVNFDGKGVDATNPLENAETSALGRALGFLGYGLFDGVASYEEVSEAMAEQDRQSKREVPNIFESMPATRGGKDSLATTAQKNTLRDLHERMNIPPSQSDAELSRLAQSRTDMESRIAECRATLNNRGFGQIMENLFAREEIPSSADTFRAATEEEVGLFTAQAEAVGMLKGDIELAIDKGGYDHQALDESIAEFERNRADAARRKFWAQINEGMRATGKTKEELKAYIIETYQKDSTKDLTEQEKADCIAWASPDEESETGIVTGLINTSDLPQTWESVLTLVGKREGIDAEELATFVCEGAGVASVDALAQSIVIRTMSQLSKPTMLTQLRRDLDKWRAAKTSA